LRLFPWCFVSFLVFNVPAALTKISFKQDLFRLCRDFNRQLCGSNRDVMNRKYLIPFLMFVFVNLVLGMYAGLGRMGWTFPFLDGYLHHGAIMVGGFLGTLIALEKVIPLKHKALLAIPAVSASSIIFFWTGNFLVGAIMLIIASIGLILVYSIYLTRQREVYMWLMLFSAVCLFIGDVVLLQERFYPMALPWWMAFLLFTIVSERLELSKFLPVTAKHKALLVAFLILFVVGIIIPFHSTGNYLSGASLILISIWLLRHDVIRINLRKKGLTKYSGIALLCGYVSLLLTGVFMVALPAVVFAYDVVVHTFFLGFVFCMIFAHGPIILPGVVGFMVKPYHDFLYVPLTLLTSSLALRIAADLNVVSSSFQLVSGYISAASILLYFATLVTVLARSQRHAKVF
jgi:hypothetical protein